MAWATRYIPDDVRGLDYGTQADFKTAPAGWSSLAAAQEIAHETKQEAIERVVQKTGVARGPEPFIPGPKSGPFGFKLPVRGGKLAAGGGGAADWLAVAAYCGMSKTTVTGDTGIITGGSSSTITALDADFPVASYFPGGWILTTADKSGTPDLQLRMITDRSSSGGTTTLTVSPDWDTDPVNLDDTHDIVILTPTIGQIATYLGFRVFMGQGSTDRHRVEYRGCAGTFKLATVGVGEFPMCEFAMQSDLWTETENSRAVAIDTLADPRLLLADQLYFDNQCVDFENLGFDPGTELIAMPGQCQDTSEGRIGWFVKRHVPAIEFVPYWDAEWYDLITNKTENKLVYMNVNDSNDAWGFGIPAAQVVAHDPGAIGDGLVGSAVQIMAIDPGQDSDSPANDIKLFSLVAAGT